MDAQIVTCMTLIQQLARHLTGLSPLKIDVSSWEEVNLIPRAYLVCIGDMTASGSHPSDPKAALLDALDSLLAVVYTRLHQARTEAVLPQLQEQARQFSQVANLGF